MKIFAGVILALFVYLILSFGQNYQGQNTELASQSGIAQTPYSSRRSAPFLFEDPEDISNDGRTTEQYPDPNSGNQNQNSYPYNIPPPLASATAHITAPQQFAVLKFGDHYTIRWSLSSPTNNLRLKLYESAVSECGYDTECLGSLTSYVKNFTLAENLSNTDKFEWQVGKVIGTQILPQGKYNLRLETAEGLLLGDSETFAVTPANQTMTLDLAVPYDPTTMPYEAEPMAFPNGETEARLGIFWNTAPSIFFVDIFVKSKSNGQIYQIARREPNGLVFGWFAGKTVTSDTIPSGDYEVYVQDADNESTKSQAHPLILE